MKKESVNLFSYLFITSYYWKISINKTKTTINNQLKDKQNWKNWKKMRMNDEEDEEDEKEWKSITRKGLTRIIIKNCLRVANCFLCLSFKWMISLSILMIRRLNKECFTNSIWIDLINESSFNTFIFSFRNSSNSEVFVK